MAYRSNPALLESAMPIPKYSKNANEIITCTYMDAAHEQLKESPASVCTRTQDALRPQRYLVIVVHRENLARMCADLSKVLRTVP